MPKYRKKPIVIEAEQWFKNGDFSKDESEMITVEGGLSFLSEGKVVRLYRDPEYADQRACWHCKERMKVHGWIDTLEGGHIVCPGDWIITGVNDEYYPCKPDIFEKSYERVYEGTMIAIDEVGRMPVSTPNLVGVGDVYTFEQSRSVADDANSTTSGSYHEALMHNARLDLPPGA